MDALGQGGVPQLQLQPEVAGRRSPRDAGAARRPRRRRLSESLAARVRPAEAGRYAATGQPPLAQPPLDAALRRASGVSRTACRAPWPAVIARMIPLGQFRDTFIIAVDDEGVAIIDQHVAHERVLFERVMERLTAGRLESQRLLVPMVIEMSAGEHAGAGRPRAPELERFGFEIEELRRRRAIKVTAVPALLDAGDSAKALLALADDLEGLDRGAHVQDALQRIAATTACHAAVKANYPLTLREDDAHPRRAEGDGVLDRLPARPAR